VSVKILDSSLLLLQRKSELDANCGKLNNLTKLMQLKFRHFARDKRFKWISSFFASIFQISSEYLLFAWPALYLKTNSECIPFQNSIKTLFVLLVKLLQLLKPSVFLVYAGVLWERVGTAFPHLSVTLLEYLDFLYQFLRVWARASGCDKFASLALPVFWPWPIATYFNTLQLNKLTNCFHTYKLTLTLGLFSSDSPFTLFFWIA